MVSIRTTEASPETADSALVAICLFEGEKPPEPLRSTAEPALSGDFSGKEGQTELVYTRGEILSSRLLLVGLGKSENFILEKTRRTAATAAKRARDLCLTEATLVPRGPEGADAGSVFQAAAEGASLGLYRFLRYKTSEEDGKELEELRLLAESEAGEARRGAETGEKVAAGESLARDLANEPASTATPEFLAKKAREISDKHSMGLTVLDRAQIEEEGLNGLATVGRSAENEPRFIALEHRGGGDEAPVVLVGKGVTFDSGGISIKPSSGMEEMKFDMSGGAAVLGAMQAVGEIGLPLNVVAIVPATENLPGGDAFRPGDVIRMHSGKTAEIVSTDAEGRLILADALSYARRYDPAAVIDCATLTGAALIALGHHASGLMGNDEELIEEVRTAGERSGERAWPLPLFEEYTEQIRGDTADIKNTGGRPGGASTAGAFLKEFAEDYQWAHLDIAGTAWEKDNAYTPKGASGIPTRLLIEFLRRRAG